MSAFSNNSRNSRGRSNGGSSRRKPRIDSSRRPKPFRPKSGGSKELRAAANSVFATAPTGKPTQKSSGADSANDNDSLGLGRRLQQVLAAAGYGSRRQCEELIRDGRVEVDGKIVAELGVRVLTGEQKIRVDGEALPKTKPTYVALNKPKNALCTNSDPQGRRRVGDFIPAQFGRLFPVGRLDQNSEGLILLTNDGALAERLTHPRFEVPKKYRVQVAGLVDFELVRDLKRGVHIAEGIVQADDVVIKSQHKLSSVLEITLKEGKNREIRRMLARLGHKVMQLQRVQVGPIKLGKMAPGDFRFLTTQEVAALYRASQTSFAASERQDADARDDFQRPGPVEISDIIRRQELEEEERAAKKDGKDVSGTGKSVRKSTAKFGGAKTVVKSATPTRGFSSEKRRDFGDSSAERSSRSEYSSERSRRDARPEFREEFRSEERRDERRRTRREYDDETRTIGPRKFDRSENSDRRDRFNADASAKRTPRNFGGRSTGDSDSSRNPRQNSRPASRPSSRPAPKGGAKGGSKGFGGGKRSRGK